MEPGGGEEGRRTGEGRNLLNDASIATGDPPGRLGFGSLHDRARRRRHGPARHAPRGDYGAPPAGGIEMAQPIRTRAERTGRRDCRVHLTSTDDINVAGPRRQPVRRPDTNSDVANGRGRDVGRPESLTSGGRRFETSRAHIDDLPYAQVKPVVLTLSVDHGLTDVPRIVASRMVRIAWPSAAVPDGRTSRRPRWFSVTGRRTALLPRLDG
jgi:hypothetical protein